MGRPYGFHANRNKYIPSFGQNLPNSSFLEKILVHSMQMKHFSMLDCFWNLSLTNSSSNPFELNSLG